MRPIASMDGRTRALAHFKMHDSHFYVATSAHHSALPAELPSKRTGNDLFSALVSIVVSQQLGVAAADRIFARVQDACDGQITAESAGKASLARLRAAGLSGAKVKTIKEIAKAVRNGSLDLFALRRESEEEATIRLTSVWGLGPWSAQMFLMFGVGHPDIFSVGDLALVRAMERIYGLSKDVPRASLLALSEAWAPHRSFACLLLWKVYRAAPLSPPTTGRHR